MAFILHSSITYRKGKSMKYLIGMLFLCSCSHSTSLEDVSEDVIKHKEGVEIIIEPYQAGQAKNK